jgi:hypothetical protein
VLHVPAELSKGHRDAGRTAPATHAGLISHGEKGNMSRRLRVAATVVKTSAPSAGCTTTLGDAGTWDLVDRDAGHSERGYVEPLSLPLKPFPLPQRSG